MRSRSGHLPRPRSKPDANFTQTFSQQTVMARSWAAQRTHEERAGDRVRSLLCGTDMLVIFQLSSFRRNSKL